jgi:peptidoglycan hydrolase-like protein with peptidoglycan-binding domain
VKFMSGGESMQENVPHYLLGAKGVGVELIQTVLKAHGHYPFEINGIFGENTEAAVRLFQQANGLVEDGIVGAVTWERLFAARLDKAYTFDDVLARELFEINLARNVRLKARRELPGDHDAIASAHGTRLFGLAFSGGGIRSATFNLGVLQALAEFKLQRTIDYLSTVSGGGYIGSWLAAWIKRERSLEQVERRLSAEPSNEVPGAVAPAAEPANSGEPAAIRLLRSYSNYITPKAGVFSADTWSVVSTYLRNLTLNLTIIIAALTALLLIPRLLVWG